MLSNTKIDTTLTDLRKLEIVQGKMAQLEGLMFWSKEQSDTYKALEAEFYELTNRLID